MMKKIFKAIADTFNNQYVKALYITIFIFIAIIIGIMIILTLFALVYFLVLYEL